MRPSGAMRKWYGRSGHPFSFWPQLCMFLTSCSGSRPFLNSTPAWWIVMYLGVWRFDSGIGWGLEPHCSRVTSFGFSTGLVVGSAAQTKLAADSRTTRIVMYRIVSLNFRQGHLSFVICQLLIVIGRSHETKD